MATKRHNNKNKIHTRKYKRAGKRSNQKNASLKRANRLHLAFGKQRAFAFASH